MEIIWSFSWFISMAVMGVFHFSMPLALIVPIVLVGAPFLPFQDNIDLVKQDTRRKFLLAGLPIFWIISGVWGSVFRHDSGYELPEWLSGVLLIVLCSFLLYGFFIIYKNKGHRIATVVWFLLNGYFMFYMTLCSAMSMSGVWL